MIEEKLQKHIKRTMILVICIIFVLLTGGGIFSAYLQQAKDKAERAQVIAEAEEYKSRILKQLEADFQTLYTLSVFLDESYTADRELLAERLDEANDNNAFLTMVYYDKNGEGVISTIGEEPILDAELSQLSSEGQTVIERALSGESSVSRLFESTISKNYIFAYSVPVYDGDEVVGALAASDHIDIFSDILTGNTVLGGGGYIHMLDSDGDFLIRSSKTIVQEDLSSIFEGPYLSEDSREEVRAALQDGERIFSSFSYEGESYPFLLEPVGINGWYLFCVNTGEGLGAASSTSLIVTQVTFILVLILMIFMMIYGYRVLRKYSDNLVRLAYHDSLTGAENLTRFNQRLNKALKTSGGSVAAISIRQFPFLNEIFGKEKTNRLLCLIKDILDKNLNKDEFSCRDTEDRFFIFFKDTDRERVRKRLEKCIDEIDKSSEISRTDYRLLFNCGVAVSEDSGNKEELSDILMNQVPFALDKAKSLNTGTIWFFDTELHKKEEVENYVESYMHQALSDGEFKLFLQPQKNLKSGKIESAEALVRWKTDSGRMIYPDQFIPVFENNGFCTELDLYMVEQVCKKIRSWIDNGIEPISVSVNQSKLLFFEADYVKKLKSLLEKYDIPANLITLEILEGLALENVDELNEKIEQLQKEGFEISLDDFGSGFSSLNTLGKLKINELKLDRDFLLNASNKYKKRIRLIMEEIVHMAGCLGISTVAEGVETPEDEKLIQEIGLNIGQGYLYSRPLSADDFDEKYMK